MAKRNLAELMAATPDVDRAKIEATTEMDINDHMIKDGEDLEAEPSGSFQVVLPPRAVRESLGLRQADFAAVLRVPLATVQNWEQGRTLPDPAARSLLNVVARAPEAALTALSPDRREEWRELSDRTTRFVVPVVAVDRPLTAADEALFREQAFVAIDERAARIGEMAVGAVGGSIGRARTRVGERRVAEEVKILRSATQLVETVSDRVSSTEVKVEDNRRR